MKRRIQEGLGAKPKEVSYLWKVMSGEDEVIRRSLKILEEVIGEPYREEVDEVRAEEWLKEQVRRRRESK